MPLTTTQIMLLDILSDRAITLVASIAKAKTMTDAECQVEIDKWEARRKAGMDELEKHQYSLHGVLKGVA